MRITVFGSTGRVGRIVVARALHDGHHVTAFARDATKLVGLDHPRLTVVVSELSHRASVCRAIDGADAVISALGPGARPCGTQLSDGMRTIVGAMESLGVPRLVALSTASVRDPADRFDIAYRVLVGGVSVAFRAARLEVVRMGDTVRSSDLDWTLVRIGLLGDTGTANVRIGYYGRGEVRLRVSATSLAELMLSLAASNDRVHQSPAVSN